MFFVDTHTHLYSFDASIIDALIQQAQQKRIKKFFLPAIDSETHEAMLALEAAYPENCVAMMGLHPVSVKENYLAELAIVEKYWQQRKFVCMGEIGLDFYWDTTFANEQRQAFRTQIEWALHYNVPINIHTRNAMQETINIVKEYVPKGLRGIFHCFSGSIESAQQIINLGFYLGIGGVVTYKNAGIAEVLAAVDIKHIVLETDAPYLAPVPFRGKENKPEYLINIAEKIADIKNITLGEVATTTSLNAKNIYNYE
jgi:TatD DNase family protein